MKLQILTVLVLTLTSVSHRAELCWAAEVPLCKAVWEPRAATSNSSCGPFCDLKWEINILTASCCPAAWPKPCCLWAQLLFPVLTPLTPVKMWLIIEQLWKKGMNLRVQNPPPCTLKKRFRGEILHSPGEWPSLGFSYKFSRSENASIPKSQGYPVKELQKKRHFVLPLELGSSGKGEFNDQCANQLELVVKQENISSTGSSWEALGVLGGSVF